MPPAGSPTSPGIIGPGAYATWRRTALGRVTEAVEQRLILDLAGDLDGADFLDVGCGDGALACVAAGHGAAAIGVDPDPSMLAAARLRAEQELVRVTFVDGRVERLPFPDSSFDVVAAVTVLRFVGDASSAVIELARVLRPGGRLVLGELGRWSLWAAIRRVRGSLGAVAWKAARFRSARELSELAQAAGLSVTTLRGAVFYPQIGLCARVLAPLDPWLGRATTFGAAFIGLSAVKPSALPERR